ncbi:MAG: hypothetical protein H0V35_12325 [Nitrospira sp.]|nr:hypothetical protein [Nitrospira sp.]
MNGYPLVIVVEEFHAQTIHSATFLATDGFVRRDAPDIPLVSPEKRHTFRVLDDPMFTVQTVALNHRIPSLAYSLQEQFHVNINKERLHEAGLPVGRWLKDVKEYLWQGKPDDFRFRVILYHEHHKEEREFVLGDVRERFVTMSRGQKLAYVVDARYDEENEAKVVDLAQGADIFYCEAPFLDRDAEKARQRYYLTARQAGLMARKAGVRELVVFHFSPRYTGLGDHITAEAQQAFRGS